MMQNRYSLRCTEEETVTCPGHLGALGLSYCTETQLRKAVSGPPHGRRELGLPTTWLLQSRQASYTTS